MAEIADALEKEAAAEMERLADDAKRLAATADADKDKPTTEPGRLLKRARRARARAEKAAADEELRAKAAVEKEAARLAKEREKAEREKEKEVARERAAKEKAEKAARIEAEKAAKAEKLAREKAEKAAKLAAEKAEKEAKLAAEKEARAKALEEAKAAKAERDAKLAAEKAQREKEREDAKLAKEAERAKAEADKRAAQEAAMAKKNKQKNQFASFFAKAAKKTPEPEAAVVAPPAPAAVLDEKRGDELVDAVLTGSTLGGADASITAFIEDARLRWRRERSALTSGDRWGARRVPKRRRDEGLLGSDRALQDAVDASVISVGTHAQPKRRKLISVQCSSHVIVDGACVQEGSYRHAFQLGPDAVTLTDGEKESFAKTFPGGRGRPPFWGSGVFPERPGSVSRAVTGRRPFARDPDVEYVTEDGEHFDSGDEWEEVEEGESLSDEDVDDDEGEGVSDDDEDGFVVKDGELSEGEGVKDTDGDDPMDLADLDDDDDDDDDDEPAAPAPGAPDSSGFRDRALARLAQWTKQARRRQQPLVIAGFERDRAGVVDEPREHAPEVDPSADESGSRREDVLRALAPVRFRPGTRAAIRVYDPTIAVEKRTNAEDGEDGGERTRKERSEFPDELLKPLVEFLLLNPKLQSKGARESFLETSQANGSHPDLTAKIADVAEYKGRRFPEEADAIRPEEESEFPRAPEAAGGVFAPQPQASEQGRQGEFPGDVPGERLAPGPDQGCCAAEDRRRRRVQGQAVGDQGRGAHLGRHDRRGGRRDQARGGERVPRRPRQTTGGVFAPQPQASEQGRQGEFPGDVPGERLAPGPDQGCCAAEDRRRRRVQGQAVGYQVGRVGDRRDRPRGCGGYAPSADSDKG